MPYVREWERLSDAVNRVMTATGISREEAQADICGAIAERAIKIRSNLKARKVPDAYTDTLTRELQIPKEIKPEDIDWESSCPIKCWPVRRGISGNQETGTWSG